MSNLVKYETARRAVSEARTVDEVKDVRDKAEALRLYAQQCKDKEMQFWAAEIKLRAERRAGELLREMGISGEMAKGGRPSMKNPSQGARGLRDYGIQWDQSSRWQLSSKITDEEFDEWLQDLSQRGKDADQFSYPTSAGLRRYILKKDLDEKRARAKLLPPPKNKFGCIVIDPPWQMERIYRDQVPDGISFDYPVMTEEELVAYGETHVLPSTLGDCHLFMWTTQKHLPMAFRLLGTWSFKYVFTMVWHKAGGFQPVNLPQYNCEFVLYAKKGKPEFVTTKRFFTCFDGARREHSRKPDEFYDVVRRVTEEPRADWFGREGREGFESIGNEPNKFGEVA